MAHRDGFSRTLLCSVMGLAHSSLYYQPQLADDLALRSEMEAVALEYPRYGYRRTPALAVTDSRCSK